MSQGGVLKKVWTPPPLVSTLPSSPYDGQEVYYLADATNGAVWHLRYRMGATGSYKWDFVGGSPLIGYSNTVYSGLAAAGAAVANPVLTVPRAGDYLLRFTLKVTNSAVAHNYIGYAKNGTPISAWGAAIPTNNSGVYWEIAAETRILALAANDTIQPAVFASTGSVQVGDRHYMLTPIRVI